MKTIGALLVLAILTIITYHHRWTERPMKTLLKVPLLTLLALSFSWGPMVWAQEAEVATLVKTLAQAYNSNDLPGMSALIADDAKLWLRVEKRYVTKPEWLKEIQRQFSAKRVLGAEWKDTRVKMVDPTHSVVETKIVVDYTRPTGTPPLSYDAEYKLEQRDGKWLIVEALAKN